MPGDLEIQLSSQTDANTTRIRFISVVNAHSRYNNLGADRPEDGNHIRPISRPFYQIIIDIKWCFYRFFACFVKALNFSCRKSNELEAKCPDLGPRVKLTQRRMIDGDIDILRDFLSSTSGGRLP
jgi:hypothetical protein